MYVQSGKGGQGEDRNNVVALLNTMVTPMFNPFIYTLRNKQVKQVFREQVNKLFLQRCTGPERRGGSYLLAWTSANAASVLTSMNYPLLDSFQHVL